MFINLKRQYITASFSKKINKKLRDTPLIVTPWPYHLVVKLGSCKHGRSQNKLITNKEGVDNIY